MPPLGGIPQTLDNAGRHKMNSSLLQEWERNWSSDIWIYKVAWGKQLQLKDICLKQILEFVKICWAEAPTHGEIYARVLYWFRTTVGRRVSSESQLRFPMRKLESRYTFATIHALFQTTCTDFRLTANIAQNHVLAGERSH